MQASAGIDRETSGARSGAAVAFPRPGPETADWCKIETRGWKSLRVRQWGKAEARLMAGEKERRRTRHEGGRKEGGDIIEPVWVSRLMELQGAAPAHRRSCALPSLNWPVSAVVVCRQTLRSFIVLFIYLFIYLFVYNAHCQRSESFFVKAFFPSTCLLKINRWKHWIQYQIKSSLSLSNV